jgi:outer membrane protein OmpA-like peptidoglycan-associated protein
MSLRKVLLGAVCAAATCAPAFAASTEGWYLGLEAGANWVDDWASVATPRGGTAGTAEGSFDTGWAAMGSVGYAFPGNFRGELELGFRENELSQTTPGSLLWDEGRLRELTAMANVLYDLDLTDRIFLSVGAGAGADRAEITDRRAGALYSEESWNLAYQGIAGLNFSLGGRTSAFLNYRYLRVGNPEFDMRQQYAGATASLQPYGFEGDDFAKHSVTAGLRYALNPPGPSMAEMAPPPPPPVTEPAAPARQFIVFFGYNKYNLTSAGQRVVVEAVRAVKETGTAAVLITGHTDTMGSPDYNQRLSMRRANAVKSELVRQGISAAAISATGKGELELLVQTNDNVKEPQNRRATIDVN